LNYRIYLYNDVIHLNQFQTMRRGATTTEKHIDQLMLTRCELQNSIIHFDHQDLIMAHTFAITRLKRFYELLRIERNNYDPHKFCEHCGERMKVRENYCECCGAEQTLS
jgi:hypothetical protein